MKPTINLYLDFEFTSLSPDAKPISIGIISDDIISHTAFGDKRNELMSHGMYNPPSIPKSFYAEFTDYNQSYCDKWVIENVINKLKFKKHLSAAYDSWENYPNEKRKFSNALEIALAELDMSVYECIGATPMIINRLQKWLKQFDSYQIQFVVDCGTWDWYHLLQLIASWNTIGSKSLGLPQIRYNISPVPTELNEIIAKQLCTTTLKAFNINRESMAFDTKSFNDKPEKHNALWDAKVIKRIYEILTLNHAIS